MIRFDAFRDFAELNEFITIGAVITFGVQLIFVLNFFYSIWKGKLLTVKNPWGATTLDWTTPIRPGHGNWPGKIPSVHRWAYDYGKDGKEIYFSNNTIGGGRGLHLIINEHIVSSESMNNKSIQTSVATTTTIGWLADFKLLIKFRLTILVVLSALLAYVIVADEGFTLTAFLVLGLGGFCITAAANALNQAIEKDLDKLMKRTANRPVATGRMSVNEAMIIGGLLFVLGIFLLASFNPLCAVLGAIAVVSYAFVIHSIETYQSLVCICGCHSRSVTNDDCCRGSGWYHNCHGHSIIRYSIFLAVSTFLVDWIFGI